MFHESTELLWIGCLTGSTWTPRSKSVTLTPNINSQTLWPKGISTRDEWNNLLHMFKISHFSSTCCAKDSSLISCPTMAKRIQEQKEEEIIVSKSKPTAMNLQQWTCLLLFRQVPHPQQVRLHLKVRGCQWESIQTLLTQRRLLKCGFKMHTLAGRWKQQRRDPSHQERSQGIRIIPKLRSGITKGTSYGETRCP